MHRVAAIVAILTAILLSSCAGVSTSSTPPPSTPFPPEACGVAFPANAPTLKLAATHATETDTALPPPQSLRIERSLISAGRWFDHADGWSTLVLRLHSDHAATLSLYLNEVEIPRDAQIWVCSADGRQRHGPYREATGGQLWTSAIKGDTLDIQVWAPSFRRVEFRGRLIEALATH
ncbi:hypothetical protein E4T66_04905 [Sinimarinibacterium sp. CAU 1509]|uniref:hypothetical protein n=1 Tax=Sinimarinibacterium sp. CAU 1509 TaxID=2562283 RepID=UPI0010AD0391|nr:hypothetical protein [Sinimarinibacterium sp. CAU 1509]TJY63052.1 hypothetical protein E4T66_04905 [Sinimarinibacterium sp. CAU 1509]